ncbi:MAG TPA: phospholipase D-like domain-containing protein, partial [Bryobacteraceae bacterium]|nr:phospholipase D-like domain-containing protein [Bryobacteraceae bacterium]
LVRVVMTNTGNAYAAEFAQLVAAGVEVSTYASDAPLYIHAKVILADYPGAAPSALVGSQNFSNASLNENRELGLTVSDPAILQSLAAALGSDFQGATPWAGSRTTAVVNAASLEAGFASSGWMTIFGSNLAPVTDDWSKYIVGGQLPAALDHVSVSVNGQAAYVAYISPSQINAIAPAVKAGAATVSVNGPNGASAAATSFAETAQPAFFAWGSYAVATHSDYSLAVKNGVLSGITVPAAPGEIITLWGAGFGPTNPAAPQGVETPEGVTYYTSSPVAVTLGGTPVSVDGAALAPGFAGLFQVAIQIPESMPNGDYALVATVSGARSPATVLLTVSER